jgi:hypothetical protein
MFLLSMLSPVWRAKLCGDIGTKERKLLIMDGEDELLFLKVVTLCCGEAVTVEKGLSELLGLARIADRYQVEAIQGDVEEAVIRRLATESCALILTTACGSGLARMERAGRAFALREFDRFAETAGFLATSAEALGSLLDDDGLVSESEERVLQAVVRWARGGAAAGDAPPRDAEGLLRKVRFPLMSGRFLAAEARQLLPESAGLEGLVLEAGLLRNIPADLWAGTARRHLAAGALAPRRDRGADWARCGGGGGGGLRLAAGQWAYSVCPHGGGFVCGGLHDGTIRVWGRAGLAVVRTLEGHTDAVMALVSVGGRLVSGSDDHGIRVWDVATGRCEGRLEGHTKEVGCLAVCGGRLVSGSWDGTARVWRVEGPVPAWVCERTLAGHAAQVNCVAAWGGRVASGSADQTIRVWDAGTGALEQALAGHAGAVAAVVACGQERLVSSSEDKTVRAWRRGAAAAAWACVATLQAYPPCSAQYVVSLAASGPALVGGSSGDPPAPGEAYEARVWDLETLEPRRTLRQAGGQYVLGLVADGGEVWAASGKDVVVWGRLE